MSVFSTLISLIAAAPNANVLSLLEKRAETARREGKLDNGQFVALDELATARFRTLEVNF